MSAAVLPAGARHVERPAATAAALRKQLIHLGNLGIAAHKAGDHNEAIRKFSEVLLIDKSNKIALYNRAATYEKIGKLPDADADLALLLANSAGDLKTYNLAGRVRSGLGDHSGAMAMFQKVLDSDHGNNTALSGMSRARAALNRPRSSLRASVGGDENEAVPRSPAPRASLQRMPFSPLPENMMSQADGAPKRKPQAAQLSTPSPTGIAVHEKKKTAAARAAVSPQPLKLAALTRLAEEGRAGPSGVKAAASLQALEAVDEEPALATQAAPSARPPAARRKRPLPPAAGSPKAPPERRRGVAGVEGGMPQAVAVPRAHAAEDDEQAPAATQAAPGAGALVPVVQEAPPRSMQVGPAGVDAATAFITTMRHFAENRITDRTCWTLQLTEHVDALALGRVDRRRLEEAQVTPLAVATADGHLVVDFSVAGVVIDACAKIYGGASVRVDVFHSWVLRTKCGLTHLIAAPSDGDDPARPSDAAPEAGAQGPASAAERRAARRADRAFLVEEGEEEKLEAGERSTPPDPLFAVAAAKFDEGGAKGMLLCSIGVRGDVQLCLDSAERASVAPPPAPGPAPPALDIRALRGLLPAGALRRPVGPATPWELFEAAGLEGADEGDWDGTFDGASESGEEGPAAPRAPAGPGPTLGGEAAAEDAPPAFFDADGEPLDDGGADVPPPDFGPPPPDEDDGGGADGGAASDAGGSVRGGRAAGEALPPELRRTFRQRVNPFWKFPRAASTGETPAKPRVKRAKRGALRVAFDGPWDAAAALALHKRQPRRAERRTVSWRATELKTKRPYGLAHFGWSFLRGGAQQQDIGANEYEVERVLASRQRRGTTEYLLKWFQYPLHEATWVPAEQVDCEELIAQFENGRDGTPDEGTASESGAEGPDDDFGDGGFGDGGFGDSGFGGVGFGALGGELGEGAGGAGPGEDAGIALVDVPRRVERLRVAYARLPFVVDVRRVKGAMWALLHEGLAREPRCSYRGAVRGLAERLPEEARLGKLAPGVLFACLLHLANERGLSLSGDCNLAEVTVAQGNPL